MKKAQFVVRSVFCMGSRFHCLRSVTHVEEVNDFQVGFDRDG